MQNLQNSFIKLLNILIVSVVSVFFVGICIGFLSDTLSLKSDQYDVIANVKIKNLSFDEEELAWEFLNYANKDYLVDDIDILYIKMGDILEGVEECSFYNPNFITILKYLLCKENA